MQIHGPDLTTYSLTMFPLRKRGHQNKRRQESEELSGSWEIALVRGCGAAKLHLAKEGKLRGVSYLEAKSPPLGLLAGSPAISFRQSIYPLLLLGSRKHVHKKQRGEGDLPLHGIANQTQSRTTVRE